jgi:hypothetical protein
MTTDRSAPERLAIRVLRPADCALWCTDGELAWGLSAAVRPISDQQLLDSERLTGKRKLTEISRFLGTSGVNSGAEVQQKIAQAATPYCA